jgi:thiol-disulfide isomerase/thioredoxin
MRVFFALCVLLTMPLTPASAIEPLSKPYAILVYADWCYNCKQILPRLDKLMPQYAQRIEFERFDMTNEDRKTRSRQRAKDLNVGPIYFANKGTGVVLLVNRQREKVGELRYTLSDEQMKTALDALAAGKPIPASSQPQPDLPKTASNKAAP